MSDEKPDRPFRPSDIGKIGSIQIIPVYDPDDERYPTEPLTALIDETKAIAYVRGEDWPFIEAELKNLTRTH